MVDPGLPQPNPTQSYWQHVPHALANTQSATLPTERDFVIIGSGITGLSVAKTLLERHPSATVTILEARTLCSGATGRNGGQMAPNAGEEYMHLAETHGSEMAGKIAKFTFQNLEKMQKLIKEYDAVETSEMQLLKKLRVFLTDDTFNNFKKSIERLKADHPSLGELYTIIDKESVLKVSTDTFEKSRILTEKGPWNSRSSWRCSCSGWHGVALPTGHQSLRSSHEEVL